MAAKAHWKAKNSSSGIHHALAERGGATASDRQALHEQPVRAAEERVALGEREAVAVDGPQHRRPPRRSPGTASAPRACSWSGPGRRRTAPGRAASSG